MNATPEPLALRLLSRALVAAVILAGACSSSGCDSAARQRVRCHDDSGRVTHRSGPHRVATVGRVVLTWQSLDLPPAAYTPRPGETCEVIR